jgi:hypothetical protein
MKNVWKGLVIGGLTGVAAGVVLDLAHRGSELAGSAGKRAADLAPKAADRLKSAATTGAAKLHDADVGDHVKELVHRLGGSIADSDVAEQARDRFERATHKGADIVQTVREAVPTGKNGEA